VAAVTVAPFRIEVPEVVLSDLIGRLERARFARPVARARWAGGTDPDYLSGLVRRWCTGFNWRDEERKLNLYSHFLADIGGEKLHFLRFTPSTPTDEVPIVLLHGWPSSFVEMIPLAERLSAPERHGSDAPAREVIVPSLPGFLFSEGQEGPWTRDRIARRIRSLLVDELGFARYAAFGGDIGGTVAAWLGALYPEEVAGVHLIHPPFPASFDETPLTPEEQGYLDAEKRYDETDGGYSAMMITRPDTIAAALIDSPTGLASWIVDKYRDWSDCDGNLGSRFGLDTLAVIATLYWVTGSIGSSMGQYYFYDQNPPRPTIEVPVAVTLAHEPGMAGFPRSIAERAWTNLVHWSEPVRGGHFLPYEEPDLMAAELAASLALMR
jgi:pimeloyl-ACP methyl ester carboxylesterase